MRSSAVNIAVGYVLFGVAALFAFAAPLWYAWQVSIEEGRAEILQEDSQRQAEVFRRDGVQRPDPLHQRARGPADRRRAHPAVRRSGRHGAGRQPAELARRRAAATRDLYHRGAELDGHPTRVMLVRAALPGGYQLLVGRDVSRLAPVETRFWYGLAAALAILAMMGTIGAVLIRRELLARIQGIRQTVSAIMQGELSHRLDTPQRRRRTGHPVADHQPHARPDRAAGARHPQRLQLHRPRSAHAACGIALAPRGTAGDAAGHAGNLRRSRLGGGRCRPGDRHLQRAAAPGRDRHRHAPLRLRAGGRGRRGRRGGGVLPAGSRAEEHHPELPTAPVRCGSPATRCCWRRRWAT